MPLPITNIEIGNSFKTWFDKTNELVDELNSIGSSTSVVLSDIKAGEGLEAQLNEDELRNPESGSLTLHVLPGTALGLMTDIGVEADADATLLTVDISGLAEISAVSDDDTYIIEDTSDTDDDFIDMSSVHGVRKKVLASNILSPTIAGNHTFSDTITIDSLKDASNVAYATVDPATNNGIAFWDTDKLKTDSDFTWNGNTVSINTATGSPLTLSGPGAANLVTNLNADRVDGWDASKEPTVDTIPVAEAGGTTINEGWIPTAARESNKKVITQADHGFTSASIGALLRFDGDVAIGWTTGQADSATNAEVLGVLTKSIDVDNFEVTFTGYISIPNAEPEFLFEPALTHFLHAVNAGQLTTTAPTASGTVRKPILFAISATEAIITNYIGLVN